MNTQKKKSPTSPKPPSTPPPESSSSPLPQPIPSTSGQCLPPPTRLNYLCTVCGLSYNSRIGLGRHARSHGVEICGYCSKTYKTKEELTNHFIFTCPAIKECHAPQTLLRNEDNNSDYITSDQPTTSTGQRRIVSICPVCCVRFTRRDNMIKHIRTVHGVGTQIPKPKYTCVECNKSFTRRSTLKKHSSIHSRTSPPPTYECPDCGSRYSKQGWLNKHMLSHDVTVLDTSASPIASTDNLDSSTPAECVNKPQSTPEVEHVDTDTFSMERWSPAPLDTLLEGLEVDTDTFSMERWSPAPLDTLLEGLEDPFPVDCFSMTQSSPKWECDADPADCHNVAQVEEESGFGPLPDDCFNVTKTERECGYGSVPSGCPTETQSIPGRENNPEPSDCTIVTQSTPIRATWFTCSQCGAKFNQKSNLTRHIRSKHDIWEYPKFTCPECSRTFKLKANCERHVLNIHSKRIAPPPKHRCSVCGKSFKFQNSLFEHFKSQSAADPDQSPSSQSLPYRCDKCRHSFHYRSSLYRHYKTSHASYSDQRPQSQPKPYRCDECGHSFHLKSSLSRHKKTIHGSTKSPQQIASTNQLVMNVASPSTSTHMPTTTPDPSFNELPSISPDLPARVQRWMLKATVNQDMTMPVASTSTAMPPNSPRPVGNNQPRVSPDLPARVQRKIFEESSKQGVTWTLIPIYETTTENFEDSEESTDGCPEEQS